MPQFREQKESGKKSLADSKWLQVIYRQLRSIRLNRNLLLFFVFLVISTGLWVLQTSQETMSSTQEFKLHIENIPQNYIITSDVPEAINVTVSAQGSAFYQYMLGRLIDNTIGRLYRQIHKDAAPLPELSVTFDYNDIDYSSSKMTISNTLLKRNIQKQLGGDFRLLAVNPTQVSIYYNTGKAKKVPVVFTPDIKTVQMREVSDIVITPDSVNVYLPTSLYDSVKAVHAVPLKLTDVIDSYSSRIALQHIDKAKISADSVDVKILVDIMTDQTITAKVFSINCPQNKVIRTFPSNLEIKYKVLSKKAKNIKAQDFLLTVDYKSIKPDDKYCKVMLDAPAGVKDAHLTQDQVQFVLEDEFE